MLFKKEDIKGMCHNEYDTGKYKIIKKDDWVDDGKYSFCGVVFQVLETGKYYQQSYSRSGSYFTDYYYDYEDWPSEVELDEVEPVEETIVKVTWVPVK